MKLLYNARVYTFDNALPQADALIVEHGRILAVGAVQDLLEQFSGRAESHDLAGATVLPGLTDAHIHLEHYALGLLKVDCETNSLQECIRRVAERVKITPPGQWVLGHGWNQNVWPEGFGSAADLDAIAPEHPVFLTAKSLHAAWANSAALRRAGISTYTPDPPGGKLGRTPAGAPDGILFENAMQLIYDVLPEADEEQVVQAIRAALPILWGMGLTGVHDFDRRRCFTALQILHQRGDLRLRVLKSLPVESLAHAAELGLRSGFGDDMLRIGQVKAFADGALGPQTAAMIDPYEGNPSNRGMLLMDVEELVEHGRLAVENGLPMAVHAIGDQANHVVLDAIEQLRRFEQERHPGQPPLRHRIEHVQVLHPQDVGRLASLGVTASMQPLHAASDMEMADHHWGLRAALSYAWKAQLDAGAVLAFGSDAPVESPNPFWGLHAAVTRRRQDGFPGLQGWYPSQRLRLVEAWRAFTSGAAYAAGMEDRLGQLSPGYLADLIVLEDDPFTIPDEELYKIRPQAVMLAGEWVLGV